MQIPTSPKSVASSTDESRQSSSSNSSPTTTTVLFPYKLQEMLSKCVVDGRDNVVSWLPDGNAFKVHNVPEFVKNILPMYFKQTKYKSFQRQLNLWGFERLTNGPDKGAYYHKQFLRDAPELCRNLTRQRARKPTAAASTTASGSSAKFTGTASAAKSGSSKANANRILVPSKASAKSGASLGGARNPSKDGPSESTLLLRQVSDSSLDETYGDLLKDFDTTNCTLDLAEFEGFTFHLLEQDRYEELNHEFKFTKPIPSSYSTEEQYQQDLNAHILLQELEQGIFGTPKTSFDTTTTATVRGGESASICAV